MVYRSHGQTHRHIASLLSKGDDRKLRSCARGKGTARAHLATEASGEVEVPGRANSQKNVDSS
jgi:hypothetical protein